MEADRNLSQHCKQPTLTGSQSIRNGEEDRYPGKLRDIEASVVLHESNEVAAVLIVPAVVPELSAFEPMTGDCYHYIEGEEIVWVENTVPGHQADLLRSSKKLESALRRLRLDKDLNVNTKLSRLVYII